MKGKSPYNPRRHHRRSIRRKGYDYAQAGLYFITICCQDRACLFGEIENGQMLLNDAGKMVETEWLKLPERFPNTALHEYVVMPNHFHAILEITPAPTGTDTPKNKTVGEMVGAFQSIVTVEYIRGVKNAGWEPFNGKLLQRNYWEHIIRDQAACRRIAEYIRANPEKWEEDRFFPG
jgi:putative transposase